MSKEMGAGGRFGIFLDSAIWAIFLLAISLVSSIRHSMCNFICVESFINCSN